MKWCLAFLLFFNSACSHLTISNQGMSAATSVKTFYRHYFFWGLIPASGISRLTEVCPRGHWSSIDLGLGAVEILVGVATAGFYVPQKVEVHCPKEQEDQASRQMIR